MNPRLFGYRPRYYLLHPLEPVRDLWLHLVYYWQRARRGWAICDTWTTDTYIAQVLSEMLLHVAQNPYAGTPWPFFEDEEQGATRYKAYLLELASAFGDYARFMHDPEQCQVDIGNVRYAELIERMRHLFDHFSTIAD